MKNRIKSVHIFVGECNGVDYTISLSKEGAEESIRSHFAFGDPNDSTCAISDKWADEINSLGWKIREEVVNAECILVKVNLGNQQETSHINWTCPACGISYSDDWGDHDELPILLICDCQHISKYYLGHSVGNGDILLID